MNLIKGRGVSVVQAARDLGVHATVLRRWLKDFAANPQDAFPGNGRQGSEQAEITLAETMAESGHYSIDSTSIRAHVSAAGGKGGFIDELLAARGTGSPVKFTVSVMEEAAPSLSTSRGVKRRTARLTTI